MAAIRLGPDAILAQTNLSGVVGDIDDDPDSPDGLWLTGSGGNNVNTDVRTSFGTPADKLTVGAGLQEFRAQVRQFDTGQSGDPDARIELWENGSLVRAGSDVSVTGSGQVISFTWNANELTGSAPFLGTNVECKVVGTKSGGSPGARNTVEAGAVEWNSDQDSSQTLSPTGIASSAALGAPTVALVPFAALSEVRFPENGGYIGPFHPSASAHYVVGLGPGLQSIHMLKTTSAAPADGDWDEQDTGIQLTSLSDCKHIWAQMNSAETLIEVMTSQDDGVIRRHSYTISSDTWTTSNELAAEVSATPTDPYSAAATNPMTVFGIESDGDINAAMLGERADASNNGFYSLERNGSWSLALSYTVNQAANGHVTTTANGPASGSGCNFLWNRTNSVCWRVRISVDSNNDSQEAIAAIPGLCAIGPGIIDSSDEVWFPYVDDTSSDLYVVHWPDSGNSTVTITQVGPISDQGDVAFNNATSQPWPCIHLGYDGTNVHGFYAAADGDLYWNKDASVTTGAEVELADGITCWNLSVAYDSNASEFWCIYTDGDRVPVMAIADNSSGLNLSPTGLASVLAFGGPTVAPGAVNLDPASLASGLAFGAPDLTTSTNLAPSAIASGTALGAPTVGVGTVDLQPPAMPSGIGFGAPALSVGAVNLVPTGPPSELAFGGPSLTTGAVDLQPTGLTSVAAFGLPSIDLVQIHGLAPPWRLAAIPAEARATTPPAEDRSGLLATETRWASILAEARTTQTRNS